MFGDLGAKELAKTLGSNGNDTLETIDLGGNALTREGRRALTYDLAGQNERLVTVCTSTKRHALDGPACFTRRTLHTHGQEPEVVAEYEAKEEEDVKARAKAKVFGSTTRKLLHK
jgi:hypothetical protein